MGLQDFPLRHLIVDKMIIQQHTKIMLIIF